MIHSRTRSNAMLTLGAGLLCACTGSMAVPQDAGRDSQSEAAADAASDSTPDADAQQQVDAGGDGSYESYCASFLDSDLACVAEKCCPQFATCNMSNECQQFQPCIIDCVSFSDAGADANAGQVYSGCVDACAMEYPTGQQQWTAYSNCHDMNCYGE